MSEIVECSNVGSCGYGVKDKLVVYPLFEAQYRFIQQQKETIKELREALLRYADCTENASASIFERIRYAESMRAIARKGE